MKVAFFTVFRRDPIHYILAEVLIKSIRATMPGVPIVQLTDETSPAIANVDEVRRRPHGKMLERRLEHYAALEMGDWLLVDTDITIREDVRPVFGTRFDIAFADRSWPHIAPTPELTAAMPYNTGVAFSRSPLFWQDVLATWRAFSPETQADWMSEQKAVAAVLRTERFALQVLPGRIYNYPPTTVNDPGIQQAAVIHYKGPRKVWMRKAA